MLHRHTLYNQQQQYTAAFTKATNAICTGTQIKHMFLFEYSFVYDAIVVVWKVANKFTHSAVLKAAAAAPTAFTSSTRYCCVSFVLTSLFHFAHSLVSRTKQTNFSFSSIQTLATVKCVLASDIYFFFCVTNISDENNTHPFYLYHLASFKSETSCWNLVFEYS